MKRHIVSDPEILSGTPVFRGTRIPLDHIVKQVAKGVSIAEIHEDYPALSDEDIAFARRQAESAQTGIPHSSQIKPVRLRRKTRAA
jgi:uncharacterized protein (DUF433 family)